MQRKKIRDSLDAFKAAVLHTATDGSWDIEVHPVVTDVPADQTWDHDWRTAYELSVAPVHNSVVIWEIDGFTSAPYRDRREPFSRAIGERDARHKFLDLCNGVSPKSGGSRKHLPPECLLMIADAQKNGWLAFYQTWGQRDARKGDDAPWRARARRLVLAPLSERVDEAQRGDRKALVVNGGSAAIVFIARAMIAEELFARFGRQYGPISDYRLLIASI